MYSNVTFYDGSHLCLYRTQLPYILRWFSPVCFSPCVVEEEGSEVGSVSQDSRSRASSFSGPEAEKRSKKAKKEKEKSLFKGFFK